jgi:hypothetical protein
MTRQHVLVDAITDRGHYHEGKPLDDDHRAWLLPDIARRGIRKPLTLFWEGGLLKIGDGWHRWMCARELGIRRVPARVFPNRASHWW